jgi:hypothetical protein
MRCCVLHLPQLGVGGQAVRVDQEGDGGGVRDDLHEALKPRRFQLLIEDAHAGHVPARPGEAADETDRDRVAAARKRDGDARGRGLCGARRGVAEGGNDGDVAPHKVGGQPRQSLELTTRPAKVERHVAVREVAAFGEALLERGHRARALVAGVQEPDHRHRGLLCTRGEWPRGRRNTEKRYELAPFHHSITSSARRRIDVGSVTPIALAVFRSTARHVENVDPTKHQGGQDQCGAG